MSVGLDIGSKTIKIVELASEKNRYVLRASGVVTHKGAKPSDVKEEKEHAVLGDVIKKLHREAKISSRDVGIALPESQVFTRTIKFPLLTDEEIASAVRWEAEQYIPIPINEAIVQHQIIEKNENASPSYVSVLLVAAPKVLVEKYAKTIDAAGLSLAFVETELIALVRSLSPTDQTVMLIDFGAESTNIAISRNSQLSFSRTIPTAGEAFTRAVTQTLGVEAQQAEEYKRAYGLSVTQLEGKVKKALDPIFRLVADEMKKAIHFYQTEEKGEVPKSVILSGGTAAMPEIAASLTKLLNMEVVVGNPFSKVDVDPEAVKSLAGYAPFYSISVGLAMRKD